MIICLSGFQEIIRKIFWVYRNDAPVCITHRLLKVKPKCRFVTRDMWNCYLINSFGANCKEHFRNVSFVKSWTHCVVFIWGAKTVRHFDFADLVLTYFNLLIWSCYSTVHTNNSKYYNLFSVTRHQTAILNTNLIYLVLMIKLTELNSING